MESILSEKLSHSISLGNKRNLINPNLNPFQSVSSLADLSVNRDFDHGIINEINSDPAFETQYQKTKINEFMNTIRKYIVDILNQIELSLNIDKLQPLYL